MKFDRVISVCMSKDLPFWKVTARNLLQHVDSHSYEVIVPDHEVALFRQATPASIQVLPEVHYCGRRGLGNLRERLPASLAARAGWYLQQFLKVEAVRSDPRDALCLIWDADTVPLRRLDFSDDAGRLVYRTGLHRPAIHQPYFELISALLGMERVVDQSFISQCFPVRSQWVRALCAELCERHRVESWWDAVVAYVADHPSACGFSEYETLGSYVIQRYPDEVTLRPGRYFRPSNRLFPIDRLDEAPVNRIARDMEYLAYDDYDRTVYGGLNVGCGHTRMEETFDGNRFLNADLVPTSTTDLTLDLDEPLPFEDASFTHVVAHNVLEHVQDVMAAVSELDRVLAPGGVLQIEVPHIGSYNHGTDVTHRRGLTFDSFNFLLHERNYLYTRGGSPFRYRLVSFNREALVDGRLTREVLNRIPALGTYREWVTAMRNFEIPGTFGFVFQKL